MDAVFISRKKISIHGLVQGMGFRPFIYRSATKLGLSGTVQNTSFGLEINVEGTPEQVTAFIDILEKDKPQQAVITSVKIEQGSSDGTGLTAAPFTIIESNVDVELTAPVLPDIAPCEDCLRELLDPADRRYLYPFINCQNCGPRASIIESLPYDRERTTMSDFKMCSACRKEYDDPADRRFHAEPCACPDCGPALSFFLTGKSADGEYTTGDGVALGVAHAGTLAVADAGTLAVELAVAALKEGKILALKGVGGYQLACDATNNAAVSELRKRKKRSNKPFAVMVRDLQTARLITQVSSVSEEALAGPAAAILLLETSGINPEVQLSTSVAPNLNELGIMLPSSPLHHLLLKAFDGPLVMTSGNISDEPIAIDDDEAVVRLSNIADCFLIHNRQILNRFDDSVMRDQGSSQMMIRRSRGFAPLPIVSSDRTSSDLGHGQSTANTNIDQQSEKKGGCVFGAGADLKNTFTFYKDGMYFSSQHIGDLENAQTADHFHDSCLRNRSFFHLDPELLVLDMHPGYQVSSLAQKMFPSVPTLAVQHHHAHIASVIAEHKLDEDVLGIALDGTGYGTDGNIWGGEILLLKRSEKYLQAHRVGHLGYMPLIGGDHAARSPALMAFGVLYSRYTATDTKGAIQNHEHAQSMPEKIDELLQDLWSRTGLSQEHRELSEQLLRSEDGLHTSSTGRLFDIVSAILGISYENTFEGEAAMRLSSICADGGLHFAPSLNYADGMALFDPWTMIEQVLDARWQGHTASDIAHAFTCTLADSFSAGAIEILKNNNIRTVCLSGGVFQNKLVFTRLAASLEKAGHQVYSNTQVPVNDGGISLGQAFLGSVHLESSGAI